MTLGQQPFRVLTDLQVVERLRRSNGISSLGGDQQDGTLQPGEGGQQQVQQDKRVRVKRLVAEPEHVDRRPRQHEAQERKHERPRPH